MFNLTNW